MAFWSKNKQPWVREYNASRHVQNKDVICQAPFNSMYFNVHGEVGPCWLNLHAMGRYPESSIHDIWFGESFTKLREAIQSDDLEYRCGTCLSNIKCGNHVSVLAKLYDYPYAIRKYPSVMEFELSNKCNLECVMCKGELSSTIRKNREKLEPLVSPYDEKFVNQLEEFIPHLEEAKFLGGEPFLIDVYYHIWELIARIKPSIKITITTNATVYNNRVKELLGRLNCNIIVSIDSFQKETYEKIRYRGNFDTVISNLESYLEYTRSKNTYMQVSLNPLRLNWEELTSAVEFVNRKGIAMWFNTVIYPHDQALWTLGSRQLEKIYNRLSSAVISSKPETCPDSVYRDNTRNYNNLVQKQIRNWWVWARDNEAQYQKELEDLSDEDLSARLHQRAVAYINEDAYLSTFAKQKSLSKVEEVLQTITVKGLQAIYLLPDSEIITAICSEKRTTGQV